MTRADRLLAGGMLMCWVTTAIACTNDPAPSLADASIPQPDGGRDEDAGVGAETDSGAPFTPACWSWPANVGATASTGWLDGGQGLLVSGDTLFELENGRWTAVRQVANVQEMMGGSGWQALFVRGAQGKADSLLYRRDGEDWRAVAGPATLGPRWASVAYNKRQIYARAASGEILRFGGERWEQVTKSAPSFSAEIALAGDVLYDWHDGRLHVLENGSFRKVPGAQVVGPFGDGQDVYARAPDASDVLMRIEPSGPKALLAPGPLVQVRVRGGQLAVQTSDPTAVYRLVDGSWQRVAGNRLLALDEDGTLLVSLESGSTDIVAPDGAMRETFAGNEPVGPLAGPGREALWSPAAHGGLLRLQDGRWQRVAGSHGLAVVALWSPASDSLFAATEDNVYRLVDGALVALPSSTPPGRIIGLVGRSERELYLTVVDEAQILRVHRWDGDAWSELTPLATPFIEDTEVFEVKSVDAPRLYGTKSFLTVQRGVELPDIDPLQSFKGLASTGGRWTTVAWHGDSTVQILPVQLGTALAPSVILLFNLDNGPNDDVTLYEVPTERDPPTIGTRGSFDRKFVGAIAGTDLEHMIGLVKGTDGMRLDVREGRAWHSIAAERLPFGAGYGSTLWHGQDAVGVADASGVTLCARSAPAADP